jgi:hypothetical protein
MTSSNVPDGAFHRAPHLIKTIERDHLRRPFALERRFRRLGL